jgi:hypothetical protein
MNIRTLALVLGSAMVVAASGMAATACSSSTNGGGGSSSGTDSGHADGTGSSSGSGSSSGGSGSSSGSSGDDGGGSSSGGEAGPDCGSTPTLHATEAGTIYCGFTDAGSLDCPTGQQCCLGGSLGGGQFAPEQCATYGSACTNGADGGAVAIECAQVSDCTANGNTKATACCLQGATLATVAGCSYPKYSHGTAIVCEGTAGPGAATACAAGETQICTGDVDCPSGMHCTAGKWKIFQLGFCQ